MGRREQERGGVWTHQKKKKEVAEVVALDVLAWP